MTNELAIGGEDFDEEDLPPLSPRERKEVLAHIRSARTKLVSGEAFRAFSSAVRWTMDIHNFAVMMMDPHVPGHEFGCRIADLAAYLYRVHTDEEAEEIVADEEELGQGN